MSEHTAQHHSATDSTMEPGSYISQIACRGDGTITLTSTALDGTPASDSITCANSTTAFDVTLGSVGLQADLLLEGAPTVYAISFHRVG
jgi:hypothetical protein